MFIAFVLIILFILLGILVGVYSIFSPFTQNIWDVIDFNSAYYGAIAGIERANLVLKYRSPGFEGSGWFFGSSNFWPISDTLDPTELGILTSRNNWFSWEISSRTSSIPAPGDGNVDSMLASVDSLNFNQLAYSTSEKISLSLDTAPSDQTIYTAGNTLSYFTWWSFSGQLRLPPKAKGIFGLGLWSDLCVDTWINQCDVDKDKVFDDIVVNRSLKWINDGVPFTILPKTSMTYYTDETSAILDEARDTSIRESVINNGGGIFFGQQNSFSSFNPIVDYQTENLLTGHNVVSSDPTSIKTKEFANALGWWLLQDVNPATGLEFSFGLVDLLRSRNGNIYPFLEYQLHFTHPVADRFYTIEWHSLVGSYDVKIIIKKSTNRDSSISDFTIIF